MGHCLVGPIWRKFDALLDRGDDPAIDGAELPLETNWYHDRLLAQEFQLTVPEDAAITGITVHIRRAAAMNDSAVDHSVQLLGYFGDLTVEDRARPERWTTTFEELSYGGPTDSWGQSWTPKVVNSAGFGVSFSVKLAGSQGSSRAFVDTVGVTAHYVECRR